MRDDHRNIQMSIIDRLVDNEPGSSRETARHFQNSLEKLKASVIRDLENLLNTRRHVDYESSSFKELSRSVYIYGVSDFTSENPKSQRVRQTLKQDVEKAVAVFEPRLKNVVVHLETSEKNERDLRFRITGLLVTEFDSEPVAFDTYFDVNRGEYKIEK